MEQASEDAPLETRAESQQVLLQRTGATGNSNSRAVKIAGITTLVCLLLSAQAFTAYMVFDQSRQIQGMQAANQKLQSQMAARSRVSPQKMVMPVGNLQMLDFFDDEKNPQTPKPEPPKQDVAPPTVEEQLRELIKDHELPQMNESFLTNLQTLKEQVTETDWKNFEAWLRYWLIFQTAQKTPTSTPQPDVYEKYRQGDIAWYCSMQIGFNVEYLSGDALLSNPVIGPTRVVQKEIQSLWINTRLFYSGHTWNEPED